MLEQIAETAQSLISTVVPKSFVGDFPSLDSEGVAIMLEEGEDTTRHFGGSESSIYKPHLVITSRSASYTTAMGWITSIRKALDGYKSGSTYGIFAQGTASHLGRDDIKMHECKLIFKILLKE